jgi:hypothetical protein
MGSYNVRGRRLLSICHGSIDSQDDQDGDEDKEAGHGAEQVTRCQGNVARVSGQESMQMACLLNGPFEYYSHKP